MGFRTLADVSGRRAAIGKEFAAESLMVRLSGSQS